MQKLINVLIIIAMTITTANATAIDRAVATSKVNKSAVAISVRDIETGKVVYEHNSKKPMIPASTLKAVTYITALNELGRDYEFTTALYKNTDNELIFKLGADPFFRTIELKGLIDAAKEKNIFEPKSVKIDDTIIDRNEWGEGWQWDDELNPLMPKFSAYNIDSNLLRLKIYAERQGMPAEIRMEEFYPVSFMNLITTGKDNNVIASKKSNISNDIITLEGTVENMVELSIPVNYPRRYFLIRLEEAMRTRKLGYYGNITPTVMPAKNVYLVEKVTHPIELATEQVMTYSNNMIAETVFKLAGGHYAKETGSIDNAVEMFKKHCAKIDVNTDDIRIVDGSGVSKNNLVTADFMTNFLTSQSKNDEEYVNIFTTPNNGTLKTRLLYLGDKLRAKTGTLSDVSAMTGFITTLSGKTYVFDIMINDAKSSASDKKMLEEYIIRAIYSKY